MDNINWEKVSEIEKIKRKSNYLRGSIEEGLSDNITGSLSADDTHVLKFHGMYQQFYRDTEIERKKAKLEPDYIFLIRVGIPGGIINAAQWLSMDDLSEKYANGTLKLTTRQAFQLHGVLKNDLKASLQQINKSLMTTISACGDVNRNVMASSHPYSSNVHVELQNIARAVSAHLTPQSRAYYQIWLDEEKVADATDGDQEPFYGALYLPRKFKIGFATPPYNDTDVFTQDLGFVAIEENGKLSGFNAFIGGGMGTTFGDKTTYPRLGTSIGFFKPNQIVNLAEKVVSIQRDFGDRENRRNARLKYTIDRLGFDNFTQELWKRLSYESEPAKKYNFLRNGDKYGWHKGLDGLWYLTLFIEGGRIQTNAVSNLKRALKEIALRGNNDFRLTGNQNLILGGISDAEKIKIIEILTSHGEYTKHISGARANSLACVAMNTCPLAFAEAERYLPSFMDKFDEILKKNDLFGEEIVIRMTGCSNGCARPYIAEIALVGKSLGSYNMYLGGSFNGSRLNFLYKENLNEQEIFNHLEPMIQAYSKTRNKDEKFGDFLIRTNVIKEIKNAKDFVH